MKRCAISETQLNDYLDGRLSPDELLLVERHLYDCATCRVYHEDLVALRVLTAELPPTMEPDRDLWPALRSRLSKRTYTSGSEGSRGQRFIRLIIAAAACLLVTLGVYKFGIQHTRIERGSDVASQSGLTIDDNMREEIATAEHAYLEAAKGFLDQLNADNTKMTADTRKALAGSLAVTDKAIEEVKAALKEHPGDFRLARKLLSTHELRVELLQQTTQLSSAMRNGG